MCPHDIFELSRDDMRILVDMSFELQHITVGKRVAAGKVMGSLGNVPEHVVASFYDLFERLSVARNWSGGTRSLVDTVSMIHAIYPYIYQIFQVDIQQVIGNGASG